MCGEGHLWPPHLRARIPRSEHFVVSSGLESEQNMPKPLQAQCQVACFGEHLPHGPGTNKRGVKGLLSEGSEHLLEHALLCGFATKLCGSARNGIPTFRDISGQAASRNSYLTRLLSISRSISRGPESSKEESKELSCYGHWLKVVLRTKKQDAETMHARKNKCVGVRCGNRNREKQPPGSGRMLPRSRRIGADVRAKTFRDIRLHDRHGTSET